MSESRKQFVAQAARIEQLEHALRWYATSPDRNTFLIVDAKDRGFISDMADWGERARAALNPTKAEFGEGNE